MISSNRVCVLETVGTVGQRLGSCQDQHELKHLCLQCPHAFLPLVTSHFGSLSPLHISDYTNMKLSNVACVYREA